MPAPAPRRSWRSSAEARPRRLLGVELRGPHVAARRRRPRRRRRSRTWRPRRRGRPGACKRVHEVHPRLVAEPGEQRVAGRTTCEHVPLHLRPLHRRRAASAPRPGMHAEARPRRGSPRLPSNSICMPMQMPRNGRPRGDGVDGASVVEAGVAQRLHARAERCRRRAARRRRPPAISAGSAVSRASAPTCCSAFCAERRLPMP